MTRTTSVAAAVIVVLAGVTAGCGLPANQHLQRVDPSTVPFDLLATAPPGTPAPQASGPVTRVYFVRNTHLVTATRRVISENIPGQAVRLLLLGPTVQEAAAGLTSDIPAQTKLISLDLAASVATVDLSPEFGTVGGSDQVLAVAQIVYTLTASKLIDAVRFAINGKPIEVPDGSGSLASTPRTRADYRDLAPSS
jgi:spore germination protein GerM